MCIFMPFPPIICTSVVKVKVSTHQTLSTLPPEPRAKKQNKKHSAQKNQKNPHTASEVSKFRKKCFLKKEAESTQC